ncbi:hypothetical protein RhiirC2_791838 [Rhizophagus irregularis]|uniref:DUF7869 domain-containing protein n=1 Tax=Rhizophagus irregularis TaxID=588596 RepID=A0A2N1MIF6_9GLOM|nr:hypothetical protein RhiirC2_791838 [Rhizophagus irregularis]
MSSEARPIYNFIELGLEEYEENEMILDVVHNLMTFFNDSANCTCRRFSNKKDIRTCFEKVGFKRFFERHMEIKALGKPKFELFIKIQLMSFEISNEKIEKNETEKKTRHSYKYSFNISLPLCKPAYLKLCNLSDYKLSALQTHLQENGLTERTHGNTGCVSRRNLRVFVDFNITSSIKEFLTQYGTIHGLPSPMRHQNDSGNFIYLPTNENYTLIYNKYKEHYCLEHSENENIISYSTFRRLWHELMPNLKFQSPASDLCETCEEFKAKMRTAKSDIDKFNIIKNQFEEHQEKADLERQHYNNNIEKSKHDLSIAHICYDWAQNVTVLYSPQQVGSIYFKTAYAVHLFGVCKTEGGENKQIKFVIGENEFPKGVAKGANTTLNMVYQAIKTFAKEGKKNLNITCDNCIAQNKNNLSLFFWSWLCMLGWYDNITINFMVPGHTKFICDSFFGQIKIIYRNNKVNTIDDIEEIVNKSSKNNEGIRYNGGIGWKCSLPQDLGKVYCSEKSGGNEICHKLLRDNNNFDKNEKLNVLDIMPMSDERKKYLYQKIRTTCRRPT